MATLATEPTAAPREAPFFQRMLIGISLVIVIGFAQHAGLGRVDYMAAPLWVHLHGVAMLGWLALLVTQSTLVQRGNVALHMRLGVAGVVLAALIVLLGSFTGMRAVELGRVPPFFTPPFFLALTQIGLLFFAGMITAAVLNRHRSDWHRRLMVGATVMIMEPGFGRLLPMPLLGAWGEWVIMLVQLATLSLVVFHDRRRLGRVHPATVIAMAAVVAVHVAIDLASRTQLFADYAAKLAAG